jgi:hypothetical protein
VCMGFCEAAREDYAPLPPPPTSGGGEGAGGLENGGYAPPPPPGRNGAGTAPREPGPRPLPENESSPEFGFFAEDETLEPVDTKQPEYDPEACKVSIHLPVR